MCWTCNRVYIKKYSEKNISNFFVCWKFFCILKNFFVFWKFFLSSDKFFHYSDKFFSEFFQNIYLFIYLFCQHICQNICQNRTTRYTVVLCYHVANSPVVHPLLIRMRNFIQNNSSLTYPKLWAAQMLGCPSFFLFFSHFFRFVDFSNLQWLAAQGAPNLSRPIPI